MRFFVQRLVPRAAQVLTSELLDNFSRDTILKVYFTVYVARIARVGDARVWTSS
jgi:hypothetical protein